VLFPEFRPGGGIGHLLRLLELADRLPDGSPTAAADHAGAAGAGYLSAADHAAAGHAGYPADAAAGHLSAADHLSAAGAGDSAASGAGGVTMLFRPGVDLAEAREAVGRCSKLGGSLRLPRLCSIASEAGTAAVGTAGLVLLDCRELSIAEFRALGFGAASGVVVGIDLAGSARRYVDYLIDTLPRVDRVCRPNLSDRGLLRYPSRSRVHPPRRFERVLLSFGGEDRSGLTERCAEAGRKLGIPELCATRGPLFGRELPAGVQCFEPQGPLRDELSRFDLVLTSFGLTAFEAAAAGCAVLLVDPSRYHQRLGRRAGFYQLGVAPGVSGLTRRLRKVFGAVEAVMQSTRAVLPDAPRELCAVLDELDRSKAVACPVCGARVAPSVSRTRGRSYLRCPECGMLYLRRLREQGISYDEQYFFEAYREQYGRSYLEDFDAIKAMGRRRLERIGAARPSAPAARSWGRPGWLGRRRRSGEARYPGTAQHSVDEQSPGTAQHSVDEQRPGMPQRPALLDIGAAYGPFLAAAREAGYDPFGVDVSDAAVRYLREELELPAVNCRVEELNPESAFGRTGFEVVTMWYVIEHLPALDEVLSKVARMLPVGGVFAFSTPNGEGVSARRNRDRFLAEGPPDHLTIWEPSRAGAILSRYGFRVTEVSITGHHPERFPGMPPEVRSGMRYRLWHLVSRAARLGDTFELYAVKVSERRERSRYV